MYDFSNLMPEFDDVEDADDFLSRLCIPDGDKAFIEGLGLCERVEGDWIPVRDLK